MASWLRSLSLAFVAAGAAGGTYVALHGGPGDEPARFRPTTLGSLVETSGPQRNGDQADHAKLPFIVIEPSDFAAPMIRLPQQYGAQPRTLSAQPGPVEMATNLRLTQGPQETLDLNPVEARLRARVPAELVGYFDLFLYVSKAKPDRGDWAQRMFVLAKEQPQTLRLLHHWKVSTGREEPMPSPSGKMLGTDTPQGMFKLDRHRFHQDYRSRQWDSPMPFAMFFDWRIDGRPSGLAIHGTDAGGEAELGTRASHGCIRLATDNARTLFELIRDNYRGRVPVFQINPDTGTMSTTGALVRDENGRVVMSNGYKVLVFIEDYGGPSVDTVATLY
jgi:hypothetical protein